MKGPVISNAPAPQALYFGPAGTECFGWLHPASGQTVDQAVGVVLCSALGREELCSHRLLRRLALALAEAGMPALRFDYPGTGDAATPGATPGQPDDTDLAHPEAWVAAVGQAIDTLRQTSGVERVCVLGLRAGALLAAEALRQRSDVAGFIALAPAFSGRALVRELKAFGMRASRPTGPGGAVPAHLESGGHAFTAPAQAALSRMDLLSATAPPAPQVLVLERDDRPGSAAPWVEHLQRQGAQVSLQPLAGYEALMAPPYQSVLPLGAIQATVDWVCALARPTAPSTRPSTTISAPQAGLAKTAAIPVSALLRLPGGGGKPVSERVCVVDPATGLNGILSWPGHAAQPAPQRALLLLPAGADRHIGPGRAYVSLARQMAAQGMAVLRLDISGVGDSPARPGCEENAVYTPQALQDVAAAVHHLRHTLGIGHVSLIGYCSGSYNAFKAAVAQVPVQTLVLVNPLVFFWKPGMSLASDTSEALVAYAAQNYRRQIWRVSRWWGLLREPRKMLYAAQVLWRRPATLLAHALRDLARHLGLPLTDDLGRELKLLAQRGVALRFVFATGDPGEALLRATGGRTVGRLAKAGALDIAHIEGADHDFTQRQHRHALVRVLADTLGATLGATLGELHATACPQHEPSRCAPLDHSLKARTSP